MLNDCNTNDRQFINQQRFLFQGRSDVKFEAHIKAQSAVHEMDLRSGSRLERPIARRLFRLPYHLLGPVVVSIDMVMVISLSVLAGVAYEWYFTGIVPGMDRYAAIGLLAFTNVSAILAARGDYRVDNLANFLRQARDLMLAWSGIFLVLLGAAAMLKVADEFSRGADVDVFCAGPIGHDCLARIARAVPSICVVGGCFCFQEDHRHRRANTFCSLTRHI